MEMMIINILMCVRKRTTTRAGSPPPGDVINRSPLRVIGTEIETSRGRKAREAGFDLGASQEYVLAMMMMK